jgi:RHS repeat-associated protein
VPSSPDVNGLTGQRLFFPSSRASPWPLVQPSRPAPLRAGRLAAGFFGPSSVTIEGMPASPRTDGSGHHLASARQAPFARARAGGRSRTHGVHTCCQPKDLARAHCKARDFKQKTQASPHCRSWKHSRARSYGTSLGRWLSRDPRGIDEDPNVYCYAQANPIGYVDPSGLARTRMICPWWTVQWGVLECHIVICSFEYGGNPLWPRDVGNFYRCWWNAVTMFESGCFSRAPNFLQMKAGCTALQVCYSAYWE